MAVTIQVKRGSRATLPVLALGEYGLTTDTKELFIGGPEGVNIQIAVLDNGGQIPEEQLPEMDISKALAGAELKDQPVDNDGVVITDSAAENVPKRVLWSRIKAALKGYFDPLYAAKSHSHAWGAITGKPETFPAAAHKHSAADVSAGTLGGQVQANAGAAAALGTAQVRNIRAGTADLTAGSSSLATGEIYLVYG
ncbi:MAG: hypothetical protein KHY49_09335 [Oscillospiraceae bacterium]|nr:hypothetical protein [Oscillospiraceae bacterium]